MEILIGILGLIIAVLTFKFSFFKKPKEELEHLKLQFNATQSLSNKVQRELTSYISKNRAENEILFNEFTCGKYLKSMKVAHEKYLSNTLLENIEERKLTKSNISSMTKSLEEQFNALLQVQTYLELKNE